MSTDDVANITVVNISNQEVEFYTASTDEWSDAHTVKLGLAEIHCTSIGYLRVKWDTLKPD